VTSPGPQASAVCLAGEAERALMRNKDAGDFNGDVFLQQRDEAAVVARSALSDIVGAKDKSASGASGKLFRMMQVGLHDDDGAAGDNSVNGYAAASAAASAV
jgi:hypothetical protein